jgi:hypothetical protein
MGKHALLGMSGTKYQEPGEMREELNICKTVI